MADIHSSAVVEDGAALGDRVVVGPYCRIGPEVVLGNDVYLHSHVVVAGRTTVGAESHIYPFAVIGLPPQDLKYRGGASRLVIGNRNIIREHVTMSPGTEGGGMLTEVGDDGLFMIGTHIAHDCRIGDWVVFANNATLGGHVVVGDYVMLGGVSAVHQHCRIGPHAMIGGMSGVENDVIPYGSVVGNRARLAGLNVVGLRRRGFSRGDIQTLRTAYRLLFAEEGTMSERLNDVTDMYRDNSVVMEIVDFIRASSSRPICQPRAGDAV